jgi:hypothetical protein
MVRGSNFLTTQHTHWPTTTLRWVLLGVLPAPPTASVIMVLSNHVGAVLFIQNVLFSSSFFPSSNLIKIRNTSDMQTVSWHAEWLLTLSGWSCFNIIWMQVYIFLNSLPLTLTQILNGIWKYLLIRPKTKKNCRKANIETAIGNFLGDTLVIALEHSQTILGKWIATHNPQSE